ncbi:MAG TPA: MarR family transcriptional regulator [Burkholderiaceae bacterium]
MRSPARDPRSTDRLDELIGDDAIGHEGRAGSADHAAVRTWLRLLSCATQVEAEIRRRLRVQFDMTLPRFDYLAQLYRFRDDQPQGLRMSALSKYLMVTGGNVTSLTDDLEKSGHVTRRVDPDDRRSFRIALTTRGRRAFERVAQAHERWIVELFSGLDDQEGAQLHALLGHLRLSVTRRLHAQDER